MTREEVFEGLKEIFAGVKPRLDLSTVSFDSRLVNDLGIDSLSMLLLSLASEHKFGMQFGNTEKTVRNGRRSLRLHRGRRQHEIITATDILPPAGSWF